ncbi:coil containing protein [Vibrio phage 1.081.O._10N.286.52.C2]|nr:coil containing protein [Vibrio phage 1.081.O._10N.286.52.C2]
MAELRATTAIGGNLVWHGGNLRFDPQGETIRYLDHKIFTEHDKPDPHTDLTESVVKRAGDTMSGSLTLGENNLQFTGIASASGDITWYNGATQQGRIWNSSSTSLSISSAVSTSTTGTGVLNLSGTSLKYSGSEVFTAASYNTLDDRYTRKASPETVTAPWLFTSAPLMSGDVANTTSSSEGVDLGSGTDSTKYASIYSNSAGANVYIRNGTHYGAHYLGITNNVPVYDGARLTRVNQAESITGAWTFNGEVTHNSHVRLNAGDWLWFQYSGKNSIRVNHNGSTNRLDIYDQDASAFASVSVGALIATSASVSGSIAAGAASITGQIRSGEQISIGGGFGGAHQVIHNDGTNVLLGNTTRGLKTYKDLTTNTGGYSYLHAGNYSTTLNPIYVNKTGDTMTGDLVIAKSNGDIHISSSANTDAFIRMTEDSSNHGAAFGYEGTINQWQIKRRNATVDSIVMYGNRSDSNVQVAGNIFANNTSRVFADNYHPNADRWTTARTLTTTLTGDVTGSASMSVTGAGNTTVTVNTTVANDSHTHDGRYYTETESNARFLGISANAVSATKLVTARTINGTSFNGTANITTANWGTARTLTIGNTGKSVNGSGNVSWSLSEMGIGHTGSVISKVVDNAGTRDLYIILNTYASNGFSGTIWTNRKSGNTQRYKIDVQAVNTTTAGDNGSYHLKWDAAQSNISMEIVRVMYQNVEHLAVVVRNVNQYQRPVYAVYVNSNTANAMVPVMIMADHADIGAESAVVTTQPSYSNTWNFSSQRFSSLLYENGNRVYSAANTNIGTGSTNYAAGSHTHTPSQVGLSNVPNTVHTTAATANTVAVRDGSGDINVRLLRPSYGNQTTISGAMAFRINNSSDNFVRFCSDTTAIRTWIGAAASSHTHSYLPLTGGTVTSNLTVNGTLSVRTAIDLADNDILRFGSGDDVEFFCNGSHMYTDLNSGIGNWYIRDGTTTRFTFDDAGHFTATGNITAGDFKTDGSIILNNSTTTANISTIVTNNSTGRQSLNLYGGSSHGGGAWAIAYGNSDASYAGSLRLGAGSTTSHKMIIHSTGGDIVGNLSATGNVSAYSDIKLKDDIEAIENSLDKIVQLRGVTYTRNDVEGRPRQSGVIAQEVQKVLPEVVVTHTDEDTGEETLSVAYGNMVGLLIEGIKEERACREQLEARLERLERPWWKRLFS